MNESIFIQLNHYFKKRGFQKIPTDIENVKMYATFQKSYLYLINVIKLNDEYIFDKEMYNRYKEITKRQFSQFNADKIILLNIILTNTIEKMYEIANYTPELESKFVDIQWLIDTNKGELIIPDKQLKNILDLEKNIIKIINNEEIELIQLIKYNDKPVITFALITINVLIWSIMELLGSSLDSKTLLKFGAMYPPYIIQERQYYRILTSMFIHIGATHLMYNCFGLYIFGVRLEKYLKRYQYITIYLLSGIIGGTLSLIFNLLINNTPIAAGASGAIYGLVGSILIYSKITHKDIEGLNDYILMVYFIVGVIISIIVGNIDIFAHLGGFISGIIITYIILKLKSSKSLVK